MPGKAIVVADNAPSDLRPNIAQDVLREGLFPKEHFDVVCFFQVFDHIVEPNPFLDLVHLYLKPGGILLAIHHNIRALYPTVFGRWASTYDISHIHLWDKHTMRLILEQHDFTVVAIDNLPTRYYFDHIVRMLPLPDFLRRAGRTLLKSTGLGRASIKVSVENMVTIARK